MHWTIDTGALGAAGCDAKDLKSVLEAAMAHHAVSQANLAWAEVMATLAKSDREDTSKLQAKSQEADAAKFAFNAYLPKLQAQMTACIESACALAEAMGGKVTCTCTGHYFVKDRPDGVFKRVTVHVDRAASTEE